MQPPRRPPRAANRVALAAFGSAALLASGNGVAIKISLRELEPLWSGALRFLLATAVLAVVMAAMRLRWPRGHELAGAVVFGFLGLGVTFALANYALQTVPAGLGQTILALVPLATVLLAVAIGQERFTVSALAGAVVAVVGVGLVYLEGAPAPIPPLSLVAVLGSVVSMSAAAVFVRRFPPVHPVAMNAVAVAVAAVVLLSGSLVAGEELVMPRSAAVVAAIGYLAVAGSVGVFSLMLVVLAHWSASRANYVMVIVPFFTIPVAAVVLSEPVPSTLLLGGALIVLGVYVGALRGTWHARGEGAAAVPRGGPARATNRGLPRPDEGEGRNG